jgi:PhnB protein
MPNRASRRERRGKSDRRSVLSGAVELQVRRQIRVREMTTKNSIAVSVTPWLSVRNGARAVEFYKLALGAKEVYHLEAPDGVVVSRLSIDGAEFWVSDESPEHGNFSPESLGGGSVKLILTVADPDTVFAKAVAAGAREVQAVQEGHGWRVGRVADPFGHHWEIGRPVE